MPSIPRIPLCSIRATHWGCLESALKLVPLGSGVNGTNLSLERIKRTPNPSSPSLLPAEEGRQNRSFAGSGKGVGTAHRVEKCAHGSGKILKLVPLGSGVIFQVNRFLSKKITPILLVLSFIRLAIVNLPIRLINIVLINRCCPFWLWAWKSGQSMQKIPFKSC